eukprot:111014_1
MASSVSFDTNCKVRIIPRGESEACTSIIESAKTFSGYVDDFESIIEQYLIGMLEIKSSELKKIKLQAIGLNNQIINEREQRKEKESESKCIITSNQNRLKKLRMNYQSLCNVENTQNELLKS